MESAGEEEDEDRELHLKNILKVVKCTEDDDFMAAFDKMMVDNIQERNNENLKVAQLDIALPMHNTDRKKKTATYVEEPVEDNAIKFVLMTRKGYKQQAEIAEKQKMKQVVLGIHERQEEEDYQENAEERSSKRTGIPKSSTLRVKNDQKCSESTKMMNL